MVLLMPKVGKIPTQERLGLSRVEAAEYIGVGPKLFDSLVASGLMPPPKKIGERLVWPRQSVEKAFAELPEDGQTPQTAAVDPWRDRPAL